MIRLRTSRPTIRLEMLKRRAFGRNAVLLFRKHCRDCGMMIFRESGRGEYYMVHDEVWAAAGMEPNGGQLCIGCLAVRLGRPLRSSDFPDAPINEPSELDTDRLWALKRLVDRPRPTPESQA